MNLNQFDGICYQFSYSHYPEKKNSTVQQSKSHMNGVV